MSGYLQSCCQPITRCQQHLGDLVAVVGTRPPFNRARADNNNHPSATLGKWRPKCPARLVNFLSGLCTLFYFSQQPRGGRDP
jgi:hypothetical protein